VLECSKNYFRDINIFVNFYFSNKILQSRFFGFNLTPFTLATEMWAKTSWNEKYAIKFPLSRWRGNGRYWRGFRGFSREPSSRQLQRTKEGNAKRV